MKEIIKNITNSVIVISIILLLLGLLFIIYPSISLKSLGIIVAIYMIIQGIILCIFNFQIKNIIFPIDTLFSGLIYIVLGIIIILKPSIIGTLLTIILGIYIISSSINYIRMSLSLKGEDVPWVLMLVFGIIDLIVGFIIVLNPFNASISLTIFIGIMLIIHAICNIVDTITFKSNIKKIKKYLEN